MAAHQLKLQNYNIEKKTQIQMCCQVNINKLHICTVNMSMLYLGGVVKPWLIFIRDVARLTKYFHLRGHVMNI